MRNDGRLASVNGWLTGGQQQDAHDESNAHVEGV